MPRVWRRVRLDGPVDLAHTLQGGQAFRWRRQADAFVGAVGARAVRYQAAPADAVDAAAWPRATRAWHARYLGLTAQDEAARRRLAKDPVLAPALAAHPGLRLLRQEPWETCVAFLTSANNNVLRIEKILAALAQKGEPLDAPFAARAFPAPEVLARVPDAELRRMGLGYRAPFVRESARMVARGDVDLDALRGGAPDEVRDALLALPGVGPKVADCIALFALDVGGAFPVDRWVLRAVSESFFEGRPLTHQAAREFARLRWGDDAGLAQQVLFHALRVREAAPGVRRLGGKQPSASRDAAALPGAWTRSSS